MFYTYILLSEKTGRYYVGYTSDVESRLTKHNSGANKSTRTGIPWRTVHTEEFRSRAEAWNREKRIKSYKSGRAFKELVK